MTALHSNREDSMRIAKAAGFLVAIAALTFLGSGVSAALEHTRYSYGFFNATDTTIYHVLLQWTRNGAKEAAAGGSLSPGAKGDSAAPPNPPAPPDSAVLTWRTVKGRKEHRLKLQIGRLVPAGARFDGTIWVKFSADGVKVIPLTFDEMDKLYKAHKHYP